MSRINTNVAALIAQHGLASSQNQLNTSLQRLSTGLQINSGADNPAGLIISNQLQSQIAGINQAVDNSNQANNVIATAEGSLNEVSSLLLDIKSLIVQSANSGAESADEISANQLQVDSAVQSISRIASSTTFAGQHLIDGSLNYVTSGVNTTAIKAMDISQADLGNQSSVPVDVNVVTSARPAELRFTTSTIGNTVTLNIGGSEGTQVLTFTSGTHASAIAFAVNRVSDSTGVSAVDVNPANWQSGITFQSSDYGSKNFVSVTAEKGSFNTTDTSGNAKQRAVGADVVATVNGAVTVGDGLTLQVNTSSLDLSLTLSKTFGVGTTQFAITGGGANFQLGAQVVSSQQVSIGIGSVAADQLGNNNVGFLSDITTGGDASLVGGNAESASQIIEAAIDQVSLLNGRLGAFQKNTLNTNIDSQNVALENVTASESQIRDANFAVETSNLTRAQILVQAGTSVLSTANSTAQSVLSLLSGH
jgi:flagellin